MFVIEYHPNGKNGWFHAFSVNSDDAKPLLEQIEMFKEKRGQSYTTGDIVPYNNSWFGIIEAINVGNAIDKFFIKFHKELYGGK